jgi:2-phosphosulfolactate phosphatase
MSFRSQAGHSFRFDWGLEGLRELAPISDVVVIVDVLRFTSAVSAAIESGCTVFPYRWAQSDAADFARARSATLAGLREDGGLSLSPTDLLTLNEHHRIVLPSPNGSTLAFAARDLGARNVFAGCLRNASATARAARHIAAPGGSIAVVAAGEQWNGSEGPLRPAVEDLLGAGAVLAALDPAASAAAPNCSPEAAAARAAFVAARWQLPEALRQSVSGQELLDRGWDDDVSTSAALDVTALAAVLLDDAFVAH